jgi:hypothetical protein
LSAIIDKPSIIFLALPLEAEVADEDMLQLVRARRDDQGYPVRHRVQALDVVGRL